MFHNTNTIMKNTPIGGLKCREATGTNSPQYILSRFHPSWVSGPPRLATHLWETGQQAVARLAPQEYCYQYLYQYLHMAYSVWQCRTIHRVYRLSLACSYSTTDYLPSLNFSMCSKYSLSRIFHVFFDFWNCMGLRKFLTMKISRFTVVHSDHQLQPCHCKQTTSKRLATISVCCTLGCIKENQTY